MTRRFIGGIKLRHTDFPTEILDEGGIRFSPEKITLSLGGGYKPTVGVGAKVKIGDTVAVRDGYIELLSGIGGTVSEITETGVTVTSDRDVSLSPRCLPASNQLGDMNQNVLRSALYAMGVPLPRRGKKSPVFLIVNCCESSPSSVSAEYVCRSKPGAVIGGAKIMMKLFGVKKAILAVPKHSYKAANELEARLPDSKMIKAVTVSDKYPQFYPRMLISSLFNIETKTKTETSDIGYPVVTAEICAAAYEALADGKPYVSTAVTVSGDGIDGVICAEVPFGSDVRELISFFGGDGEPYCGLPAMRPAPAAVGHETDAVVSVRSPENVRVQPCIECGRCADVCPVSIVPSLIYEKAVSGNTDGAERYLSSSCIGCRCCDAVCPSGIPLAGTVFASNAVKEDNNDE